MEGDAYLGELAAGIIYMLAGARLALLGLRTGQTPERLLGASFMFIGLSGVVYGLAVVEPLRPIWTPLNFIARVAYLPGSVLIAVFTARVFRPNDGWARWILWGVVALVVVGVGSSALHGDWEGFSLSSAGFWLEWVGYTLPFGWAAAEAFKQYLQARRRVSIGLCEPSVCNRMLLWSLFGAFQFTSCLVVVGQYAAFERANVWSSSWDLLYSGVTLSALVVMWIAFFPPKFYVRLINASVAKSGSAVD
jgi:hypothetical protein